MKKIIALYTSLILLIGAIPAVSAYSADEDMEVVTYKMLNSAGEAISEVVSADDIIDVEILIKNWHQENTPITMYAVVSDDSTGRLRGIKDIGGSIEKFGKMMFKTKIDLSSMDGVEAGDKIDFYFWSSLTGMQQLMNKVSGDKTQNTLYTTNNILDYNTETNVIAGDRWSYLCQNEIHIGDDETVVVSPYLCGNNSGRWHIDPERKPDTWFMTPKGEVNNENGRIMVWNYTIGSFTENKKLTISGKFSGADARLIVLKTDDNNVSKLTGNSIAEIKIGSYHKPANAVEDFSIEIPATEAVSGNDIMFVVAPTSGNYQVTKLDVTISAKEVPSKKTNSINEYSQENIINGGCWSYIDKPAVALNEGSENMGVFSYDGLLAKGDGEDRKTDEYYSELEDKSTKCYIKPDGTVYTGIHAIGYVYTINAGFVGADELIINAKVSAKNNNTLTVVKVSDGNSTSIGENAEILYSGINKEHAFLTSLSSEDYNVGDDIIFIVQHNNKNNYFLPINTDFGINAQFREE